MRRWRHVTTFCRCVWGQWVLGFFRATSAWWVVCASMSTAASRTSLVHCYLENLWSDDIKAILYVLHNAQTHVEDDLVTWRTAILDKTAALFTCYLNTKDGIVFLAELCCSLQWRIQKLHGNSGAKIVEHLMQK